MYLLNIEIDNIDKNIIGNKFLIFIPIINNLYKNLSDFDQPSEIKYYIKVLGKMLLCIESDMNLWSNDITKQAFLTLLLCAINKNPKVRKWSKESINDILSYNSQTNFSRPFDIILDFSAIIIKEITSQEKGEDLAILSLLSNIAPYMSLKHINQVTNLILKVFLYNLQILVLYNEILSLLVFQIFNNILKSNPNLNNEFCKNLLISLLNHQSNIKYHKPNTVNEYISLLASIINYVEPLDTIYDFISPAITYIISYFQLCNNSVNQAIIISITIILQKTITNNTPDFIIKSIVEAVETVTTFQYQQSWRESLNVLNPLFIALKDKRNIIEDLIISIASLRNAAVENKEPYSGTINHLLSVALQTIGPSAFLEIIPLRQLNNDTMGIPDDKLWILKLLKENCGKTDGYIEFFINKYFYKYFFQIITSSTIL